MPKEDRIARAHREVVNEVRYDKALCPNCHGKPPRGFSCLQCLALTAPTNVPESFLKRLEEIELGDTNELDVAWDAFIEYVHPMLALSALGVMPVAVSRLFRVAIDAWKAHDRQS